MGKKVTDYIITLWDDVISSRSEMAWHRLSDKVFDYVSFNGGFAEGELEFLLGKLKEDSEKDYVYEAIPALRALAALCEDRLVDITLIEDVLSQALFSDNIDIRREAVHAIWQVADLRFLPSLQEAYNEKRNDTIKDTLEHVIRIFSSK